LGPGDATFLGVSHSLANTSSNPAESDAQVGALGAQNFDCIAIGILLPLARESFFFQSPCTFIALGPPFAIR
jgi:hypothetical protein